MTLQERIEEVMAAMNWTHADLMRVSGQSSSTVSQWRGRASKTIKTIGKIEAALSIEKASGYSATWIAKGIGPKRVSPVPPSGAIAAVAKEPAAQYAGLPEDMAALLRDMQDALASPRLARKLEELRSEVAEMREFARNLSARQAPAPEGQSTGKKPPKRAAS